MGVICQLLLQNTNEGSSYYKPGQPVVGKVKYVIDEPTEYENVILSLFGAGLSRWITQISNSTHIFTGTEEYVSQHMDLLQAGPNEAKTLQAGSYEYPFQFVLPENIPSSYKDDVCNITYKVELRFTKPALINKSKKFCAKIDVQGDIKPSIPPPVVAGIKKDFISLSGNKRLDLKAQIDGTFINAGENITVQLFVNKETGIRVTAVQTELEKHITYTANCNHQLPSAKTVKGSVKEHPGFKEKTESTLTYVVPTYPDLFSIQDSKVFSKEYKVKVTIKVPFPYKNVSVELPVVINRVTYANDAPPPYWLAMNEENDKDDNLPGKSGKGKDM